MTGGGSAETAAMAAVMAEDYGQAREILEDFFPSELDQIIRDAEMLIDLAKDVRRMKGAR